MEAAAVSRTSADTEISSGGRPTSRGPSSGRNVEMADQSAKSSPRKPVADGVIGAYRSTNSTIFDCSDCRSGQPLAAASGGRRIQMKRPTNPIATNTPIIESINRKGRGTNPRRPRAKRRPTPWPSSAPRSTAAAAIASRWFCPSIFKSSIPEPTHRAVAKPPAANPTHAPRRPIRPPRQPAITAKARRAPATASNTMVHHSGFY